MTTLNSHHRDMWTRLVAPVLLIALYSLLSTLPVLAAPSLDLTVDTSVPAGQSVRPGDAFTLTVTLAYTGGSGTVNTGVTTTLPRGLKLAERTILSESPAQSVDPLQVRRRGNTVAWQGALDNGGQLTLRVPVRVDHCWGGFRVLTILAVAQRPSGETEQASREIQVHCPLATLDDIQVNQQVMRTDAPAWAPYDPSLLPGHGLTLRTTFRNDAPVPVLLGVSRPRLLAVGSSQMGAGPAQRITLLALAPGESRSVDQAIKPGRAISPDSLLDGDVSLTVGVVYCLLTGDGRTCATTGPEQARSGLAAGCGEGGPGQPRIPCPDPGPIPDPTGQVTVTVPVRPNDLGDAPDSTNHAGQTMTAYPGVTARFPTVFARLPGEAAGPLHRYPRPVHLGPRVSMEAEADAGPDADPTNNLLPGQDAAGRDRFDDGLKLSSVALKNCQPARMQVRVELLNNQAKQALLKRNIQVLYLNVWIDGNRDGDWNDTGPCSQQPGDLALEHIVIDHPVSVGQLTPGNNLVSMVSNVKALWPDSLTDQAAWLRITLSEAKSPKLPSRTYGDGRGPAKGYRLGETEDYLWRPPGTADVVVAQSSTWVNQPDFGNETSLDTERFAQFRITYGNEGNAQAQDVKITQKLTGFGGQPQLVHVSAPGLPNNAVRPGDGEIVFALGDLAPGTGGSILVGWQPQTGARSLTGGSRYTATVTVSSQNDANPGNDSAATGIEETPFVQMGFRTGDGLPLLRQGSTCRDGIQLVGRATPGARLRLMLDGVDMGLTVLVGADGRWQQPLTGLSDGLHQIEVWVGFQADALGRPMGSGLTVRVDGALPVDPASFTVIDAAGRIFAMDTLGTSWRNLRLPGSGPFELGVTGCTELEHVVSKYIGETEKNIVLTDPDGDGRYTGLLDLGGRLRTSSRANLSLTVTSADGATQAVTTFDVSGEMDALGTVVDAVTGQPVVGAQVVLLAEQASLSARGADFGAVPLDSDLGQANPQTTAADGSFFFAPPPGVYRLLVTKTGYQPYRTAGMEVDAGGMNPTIHLAPAVSDPPDVTMMVGEGGFAPNVLTVPPGTVVAWVNVDLAEHSVQGDAWNSGVLWPGESFRLRLDETGSFAYRDGENPLNQGTIVVDPSAPSPGTWFIFLPSVER